MGAPGLALLLVVLLAAVLPLWGGGADAAQQPAPATTNWPSFRGPAAAGVSDGLELPDVFSGADGTNLAWKTEIPGLAHSSPIVWGDRVYVTTAESSGPPLRFIAELPETPESMTDTTRHEWKLLALDKSTGEVLWERTAAQGVPKTGRLRKGSFNNSTPTTDGEHIVALFGSEGLFCYDIEGNQLWHVDLGVLDAGWFFDPTFQWGTASSPIIHDGKVIVQADVRGGAFIAAFDVNDGTELWRTARDEVSGWATPLVVSSDAGVEIVTNGGRAIRGYDADSGEELWQLNAGSEIAVPTPVAAGGLVFIGSGYLPRQPIFAIRPGGRGDISLDGAQTASREVAWSTPDKGPLLSTPIVVGPYVYFLSRDGIVSCFDAGTGIHVFTEPIEAAKEDTGGVVAPGAGEADEAAAAEEPPVAHYSASPVASNGKIYFASESGEIHIVQAGAFATVTATYQLGEAIFATPAISDGMLFVRGQRHLFAFSR